MRLPAVTLEGKAELIEAAPVVTVKAFCTKTIGLATLFTVTVSDRLARLRFDSPAVMASQLGLSSLSLVYSSILLAANSFNPFIYFRF